MLTDRGEHGQHGGGDLQEHLPPMADELARLLKQEPAHGLRARALKLSAERDAAKAQIYIVGQHADGEESRIG